MHKTKEAVVGSVVQVVKGINATKRPQSWCYATGDNRRILFLSKRAVLKRRFVA